MRIDRVKAKVCMARRELGVSALADLAGLSRQTVSTALHGKDLPPVTLGKIAAALGVDPANIIEK